jgi:DNA-binding NtrC family response regulator
MEHGGGTLFLDEIADLPLPAQAALLRVLQERKVTPVGDTEQIDVNLRVIAASHHDLSQRVERGEFRRDLYARLAAFTVHLPPLRERRCDFGLLLAALLPRGATLSPQAARELLRHDWPLNVRGLESCLRVASALAGDKRIKREHLGSRCPTSCPRRLAERSPRMSNRASTSS